MMRKFLNDTRGAAVIEMAFALPVTIMMMIGILQFSLVLQASGGLRHGIGQGLRYAKVNTVSDPSNAAEVAAHKKKIEDIAYEALAGMDRDGIKSIKFTDGTDANGAQFGQIDIKYEIKPLIPFAAMNAIPINETRRVYLPS